MSLPSIETQTRLAELRSKIRDGQPLSIDENREIIQILRADRLAMPQTKASASRKAPPPNADDLLSELGI